LCKHAFASGLLIINGHPNSESFNFALALTKGFIDRLFLPGMAFQYRENSVWWDKLLKGKTLDQPGWYYRLVYARPSVNQLKKCTLQFCGITPVKVSYTGIVKTANEPQRKKWLQNVYNFGLRNK
jgi:NAD(P)H dehydrogenase (quinone)